MMIPSDWFLKHAKKPEDQALQNVIPLKTSTHQKKLESNKEAKRIPKKVSELIENMSVLEAASYLGCDKSYLYEQIRLGNLKCQPFGRRRVIPVTALYEFMEQQKKDYEAGRKSS